jgi:tryptophan synthase alpha chain
MAQKEARKLLIPYLTAGFPSEKDFVTLASRFLSGSADILEVGMPFSDPLADGPTIQFSSQQALRRGMTVGKMLGLLGRLDNPHDRPIVVMSYINPLLQFGLRRFATTAREAGVSGIVIPDVICEEGDEIQSTLQSEGIDTICLLARTSTPERRRMILNRSRGFVYLVSVSGVTGARNRLPGDINDWIRSVRSQTTTPVAVGFGISNAALARQIGRDADAVIVGSAIIDILRNGYGRTRAIEEAVRFLDSLREALETDDNIPTEKRL